MRAIVVTCPQCGANLRVDGTVVAVTCQYCGTEARIQQRSRVFQVPRPLPSPPSHPHHPQASMPPVARQNVSTLAVLIPIIVMVGVAGAGSYAAMRFQRGVQRAVETSANAGKERVDWYGGAPVLADADGDGVADLIGFVHYILDDDRTHLAAFSSKTGARLWQSESLGKSETVNQAMLGAAADTIYYVTDDGVLHARDRANGTVRWQSPLGEKIDGMCAGAGSGEIVVQTADGQWWIVDGQGAKRPGTALTRLDRGGSKPDEALKQFHGVGGEGLPGLCLPIDNRAWQRPVQLLTIDNWSKLPTVPGVYVERLVRRPGGPVLAVGYKQPGTAVPMLARVDGKKVAWTTEVPATDPLTSSSDDKIIGMSERAAFVVYQPRSSSGPTRLAAFDLADGKRLWERDLQQGVGSLSVGSVIVAGDVVIVATWGHLQALDQQDGTPRFVIGTI